MPIKYYSTIYNSRVCRTWHLSNIKRFLYFSNLYLIIRFARERERKKKKITKFTFFDAFAKLRKASWLSVYVSPSVRPSVRPSARYNLAPTGRILITFNIFAFFFRKSVEKIQVSLKSDNNNRHFTWRRSHVCDNISLNYSQNEKYFKINLVEKIRIHILRLLTFSENRAVHEKMSKNLVEPEQTINGNTILRIRVSCWISKVNANAPQCCVIRTLPVLLINWLAARLLQ
jgi:hypothetical protein